MNLSQRLDAIRKASDTRIPAAAAAIMHRATDDLRRSGILDRVVKVGQKAPSFELLNQRGDPVSSGALLAKGSLVVTFYRGVW
jgi:hypothetical protein